MTSTPVCTGHLSKLSKQGATTWKKKFFVLLPDGTLSCSDKQGTPPKQVFHLTSESFVDEIPEGELKGATGFYIQVNSSDLVCVKSGKASDIETWQMAISGILSSFEAKAKAGKNRLSVSDIYSKMTKTTGQNTGRLRGYQMKVGKKAQSLDYFVNANTFEYFKSEDDCVRGTKPVGKATLNVLV